MHIQRRSAPIPAEQYRDGLRDSREGRILDIELVNKQVSKAIIATPSSPNIHNGNTPQPFHPPFPFHLACSQPVPASYPEPLDLGASYAAAAAFPDRPSTRPPRKADRPQALKPSLSLPYINAPYPYNPNAFPKADLYKSVSQVSEIKPLRRVSHPPDIPIVATGSLGLDLAQKVGPAHKPRFVQAPRFPSQTAPPVDKPIFLPMDGTEKCRDSEGYRELPPVNASRVKAATSTRQQRRPATPYNHNILIREGTPTECPRGHTPEPIECFCKKCSLPKIPQPIPVAYRAQAQNELLMWDGRPRL